MTELTNIDGKLYQLDASDTAIFDPAINIPHDLTGQPLKVGTKVAWGTSYRGGGGAVVGEITDIGYAQEQYYCYERNEQGGLVLQTIEYEGMDYSVRPPVKKPMTRSVPATIKRARYSFRVTAKSLQSGRKGNSFRNPHDVAVIANQQFAG